MYTIKCSKFSNQERWLWWHCQKSITGARKWVYTYFFFFYSSFQAWIVVNTHSICEIMCCMRGWHKHNLFGCMCNEGQRASSNVTTRDMEWSCSHTKEPIQGTTGGSDATERQRLDFIQQWSCSPFLESLGLYIRWNHQLLLGFICNILKCKILWLI